MVQSGLETCHWCKILFVWWAHAAWTKEDEASLQVVSRRRDASRAQALHASGSAASAGAELRSGAKEVSWGGLVPERPNVHLQRLAAIGRFLTFRSGRQRHSISSGQAPRDPGSGVAPSGGGHSTLSNSGRFSKHGKCSNEAGPLNAGLCRAEEAVQPLLRPGGGVVVEEVFENERWQPFRGWGHLWPGHFLPTDPVRHWCDRFGRSVGRGLAFQENAPALPPGWTWCASPHCEMLLCSCLGPL
jgi:hypothetical protein